MFTCQVLCQSDASCSRKYLLSCVWVVPREGLATKAAFENTTPKTPSVFLSYESSMCKTAIEHRAVSERVHPSLLLGGERRFRRGIFSEKSLNPQFRHLLHSETQ